MPKFDRDRSNNGGMGEELVALERAEVQKRLDKIKPPRINEPRCLVCTHEQRDFIEFSLVQGASYSSIANRVDPTVDRRSVSNHHKKHMDLQDAVLIGIIEKEFDKVADQNSEYVEDMITQRGVLEVALRKGFEDLRNGVTTVEPKDIIQIVKLMADMDSHATEQSAAEAQASISIFMEAIRSVVTPEQVSLIGQKVGELRQQKEIRTKFENQLLPGTVDGELVEDD